MKKLSDEVVEFFRSQGFVIVTTIDSDGYPHNSCKGIVELQPQGLVYLLDLYQGKTARNLKRNQHMSITAVDEHRFKGYCLKGVARLAAGKKLKEELVGAWEDRIISRLTQRVLKNVSGQKGHPRHPEALLPDPKYLIAVKVQEVIDLTPHLLKQEA